jgi:hypothetical protein
MTLRGTITTLVALTLATGCQPAKTDVVDPVIYADASYEVPPARMVIGPDAGGDGSASGAGGTSAGSGMGGDSGSSGGGAGAGGAGGGGSGSASSTSCNVSRTDQCMTGDMCLPSVFAEGDDNGGICYKAGTKAYKERCSQHQECAAGLVCSPDSFQGCRYGCDPTAPACPDGGKCTELARYNRTGYCGDP